MTPYLLEKQATNGYMIYLQYSSLRKGATLLFRLLEALDLMQELYFHYIQLHKK